MPSPFERYKGGIRPIEGIRETGAVIGGSMASGLSGLGKDIAGALKEYRDVTEEAKKDYTKTLTREAIENVDPFDTVEESLQFDPSPYTGGSVKDWVENTRNEYATWRDRIGAIASETGMPAPSFEDEDAALFRALGSLSESLDAPNAPAISPADKDGLRAALYDAQQSVTAARRDRSYNAIDAFVRDFDNEDTDVALDSYIEALGAQGAVDYLDKDRMAVKAPGEGVRRMTQEQTLQEFRSAPGLRNVDSLTDEEKTAIGVPALEAESRAYEEGKFVWNVPSQTVGKARDAANRPAETISQNRFLRRFTTAKAAEEAFSPENVKETFNLYIEDFVAALRQDKPGITDDEIEDEITSLEAESAGFRYDAKLQPGESPAGFKKRKAKAARDFLEKNAEVQGAKTPGQIVGDAALVAGGAAAGVGAGVGLWKGSKYAYSAAKGAAQGSRVREAERSIKERRVAERLADPKRGAQFSADRAKSVQRAMVDLDGMTEAQAKAKFDQMYFEERDRLHKESGKPQNKLTPSERSAINERARKNVAEKLATDYEARMVASGAAPGDVKGAKKGFLAAVDKYDTEVVNRLDAEELAESRKIIQGEIDAALGKRVKDAGHKNIDELKRADPKLARKIMMEATDEVLDNRNVAGLLKRFGKKGAAVAAIASMVGLVANEGDKAIDAYFAQSDEVSAMKQDLKVLFGEGGPSAVLANAGAVRDASQKAVREGQVAIDKKLAEKRGEAFDEQAALAATQAKFTEVDPSIVSAGYGMAPVAKKPSVYTRQVFDYVRNAFPEADPDVITHVMNGMRPNHEFITDPVSGARLILIRDPETGAVKTIEQIKSFGEADGTANVVGVPVVGPDGRVRGYSPISYGNGALQVMGSYKRGTSADVVGKTNGTLQELGRALDILQQMEAIFNAYGSEMYGPYAGAMDAKANELIATFRKRLGDSGALTQYDVERLIAQLPNPSGWGGAMTKNTTHKAKFEHSKAYLSQRIRDIATEHGLGIQVRQSYGGTAEQAVFGSGSREDEISARKIAIRNRQP